MTVTNNITGDIRVNFCTKFKVFNNFHQIFNGDWITVFVLVRVTVNAPLVRVPVAGYSYTRNRYSYQCECGLRLMTFDVQAQTNAVMFTSLSVKWVLSFSSSGFKKRIFTSAVNTKHLTLWVKRPNVCQITKITLTIKTESNQLCTMCCWKGNWWAKSIFQQVLVKARVTTEERTN